jgi:hypothetical protein
MGLKVISFSVYMAQFMVKKKYWWGVRLLYWVWAFFFRGFPLFMLGVILLYSGQYYSGFLFKYWAFRITVGVLPIFPWCFYLAVGVLPFCGGFRRFVVECFFTVGVFPPCQ